MARLVYFLPIGNIYPIIMIQTIIALFIVALALVWVLMRITRSSKKGACNCGCTSCPDKVKKNCHNYKQLNHR